MFAAPCTNGPNYAFAPVAGITTNGSKVRDSAVDGYDLAALHLIGRLRRSSLATDFAKSRRGRFRERAQQTRSGSASGSNRTFTKRVEPSSNAPAQWPEKVTRAALAARVVAGCYIPKLAL
jgi:hypothetical protein